MFLCRHFCSAQYQSIFGLISEWDLQQHFQIKYGKASDGEKLSTDQECPASPNIELLHLTNNP